MRELSKFKVFTIVFLCTFVFVIGAIYTNTKEITRKKMNTNNTPRIEQQVNEEVRINKNNSANSVYEDLSTRIGNVENRIDNVVSAMSANNASNDKMNCQIQGIMDNGSFVAITESEAYDEAKNNGKSLVLTCNFQ